ncbi:probable 37S ribosomal protein S16,mitochondrial [Zygosaccharomyces bailii ISA1307]|uniref:ZYBA0S09-00716g1_1 n=1 Tax=Zygosaccharomyces bailii (strain CLIB 213 / ATCC 58445 / CBS 680 / BCRC 21525 / NBRC 1098 / NCYC 1416 / NRRL Y-2227) TaxID=1333698 RepID=A0A8J2T8Y4_ZYGB2|nr:ZYBA0S09-00716g1_1 [Zygosaccharomyces bailii CLIB 213]CDH13947.1 probable 37S ribosomal protein S16,mitochondrial [Zygosaccharomyces bailii ISA1307]
MTHGLVRIRLARFGRVNNPAYNIVVARAFKARDTKPIEVLGTYNPVPKPLTPLQKKAGILPTKDIKLDFDRTKYWIGVGAQPSDTVTKLLKKCGILDEAWGKNYSSDRPIVSPRKEIIE